MMKTKIVTLFFFLVLFHSCTLHPPYSRPVVEAPTKWRIPTDQTCSFANVAWWKALGDPVLDDLIDEALKNNEDLKVAIYRVNEFEAKLGIARSNLYPQISANAVAGREKISANTIPPLSSSISTIGNDYSLLLNASYLVDIWGQVRSATEVALGELLAQVEIRRTVVLTLVSAVASSYIELKQFDKQQVIAKLTLKSRLDSLKLAKTRYELGLTSEMQVQQAKSEAESAEAELDQIKISVALTEDLLSFLIGSSSRQIKRGKILDEIIMPPKIPSYLPSEIVNQRPDILAAEQDLIAANAQIGVARAEFFPQISLTGAYGGESTQLNNLLSSPSIVWQYGVNILQEIFTGGKITSEVNLAKAQKLELLHQYKSTILNAFKEVNDALISHKITLDLVKVLEERVETVASYLHLSDLRYREGLTDYLTFLDAEREYFRAQLDYAKAQGDSFTTLIDIYKALGGGWVIKADKYVMDQNKDEKP